MYLDVPEDLKDEFEDYKFSIEEKRRLYWTAMKYTALPLVLFIVIVPFHITSDYVLFYVAIVFFGARFPQYSVRHHARTEEQIVQLFAQRNLRICHDPGLNVAAVSVD